MIGMRERYFPFPQTPEINKQSDLEDFSGRQIAIKMLSLTDVALPIGFKFAVIEPGGRILFHSDTHRNLTENFFSECDAPSRFRAIAERRTPAHFTDTYAGSSYFFYMRPLFPIQRHSDDDPFDALRPPVHGVNWTLVVFRDSDYVHSLQLEAGMLTFSLLAAAVLTIAFGYLFWTLHRALWKGRGLANFTRLWKIRDHWPKESRRDHYAAVAALALFGAILIFGIVVLAPFRNLKWIATFYLIVAIVAGGLVTATGELLKRCGAVWLWWAFKQSALKRLGTKSILVVYSAHLACVTFAVIGSGMLILYRVSLDTTLAEHRALSRREAVTTFHERFARIRLYSLRLGLREKEREAWVRERVLSSLDLYDPFVGNDTERVIREVRDQPHVRLAVALGQPVLERMWGTNSMDQLHASIGAGNLADDFPARNEAQLPLKQLSNLPTPDLEERAIGPWPVLPSLFGGRGPAEALDLALGVNSDLVLVPERVRTALLLEPESIVFYSVQVFVGFLLGLWMLGVITEIYAQGFEDREPPQKRRELSLTDFLGTGTGLGAGVLRAGNRQFFLSQPMSGASHRIKELTKARPSGVIVFDCASEMAKRLESIEWDIRRSIGEVSQATLVIVDNLEFRISEPLIDAQKLKLIETAAVRSDCAVICLSSVDPVEHLASLRREAKSAEAAADLDQQIARWMRVLGIFEWYAYEPHDELDWRLNPSFRLELEQVLVNRTTEMGDNIQESPWPQECRLLGPAVEAKDPDRIGEIKKLRARYESDYSFRFARMFRWTIEVALVLASLVLVSQFFDLWIERRYLRDFIDSWWPFGAISVFALGTIGLVVGSLWILESPAKIDGGTPDEQTANPSGGRERLEARVAAVANALLVPVGLGVCTAYSVVSLFPEVGWFRLLLLLCASLLIASVYLATRWRLVAAVKLLEASAEKLKARVRNYPATDGISSRQGFLNQLKEIEESGDVSNAIVRTAARKFRFAHFDPNPMDEKVRDSHGLDDIFGKIRDEMDASVCMRDPGRYRPLIQRSLEIAHNRGSVGIGGIDASDFFRILSNQVREVMEGYYRMVWNTTTKEERLVLYQLSRDGWINPKNKRAIGHLMRRRIILVGEVGYRTLSSSFARFVVDVQPQHEIEEWIAEEKASVWQSLRIGLYSLVVAILAFLWYIQPELFHSYVRGLFALSAGIFSIFRVYSEISRKVRSKFNSVPSGSAPERTAT